MKSSEWQVIKAAKEAGLPDPGFEFDATTAIVMTDPQNDFLHSDGVAWPIVKDSVKENNTIENMVTLFRLAKEKNFMIFISPHYFFPIDEGWKFEGALEKFMHRKKCTQEKEG